MKTKKRKVGAIGRFFMWLFRIEYKPSLDLDSCDEESCSTKKTLFDVAEEESISVDDFEKIENEPQNSFDQPSISEIERLHSKYGVEESKDSAKPIVKQNLNPKYNPNVERGADGRFKSKK